MSNISSHHRRTPWISALDFFRGTAEQRYAHPGSIVGAGSLHTGQVDSPATVAAWAAAGLVSVGNTCVPYCEPGPVLPRSCAGSSQPCVAHVPARRASICVRGAPATCPDSRGWQKKMRGGCPAAGTSPTRSPCLAGESERESRTLPRHHLVLQL